MRGTLADMWHEADDAGKKDMLTRALQRDIALSADLLQDEPYRVDDVAQKVGLVPVYMVSVDAAGLSCLTPGVASPNSAQRYRSRRWWCGPDSPAN